VLVPRIVLGVAAALLAIAAVIISIIVFLLLRQRKTRQATRNWRSGRRRGEENEGANTVDDW
jgi:uncharacterized membrane protein